MTDQHPEPESAADCLAARPLIAKVAAMGDCIGRHTVNEIIAISNQAASWLAANPPGQPVAIEPLGCPLPGACSCVAPQPPTAGEVAESNEWFTVALIAQDMRSRGLAEQSAGDELLKMANRNRHPTPQPEAEGVSADEWDALVERAWDKCKTVGYQGELFIYESDFCFALDFVRKELARWGRSTPQPVAWSERPTTPEDTND